MEVKKKGKKKTLLFSGKAFLFFLILPKMSGSFPLPKTSGSFFFPYQKWVEVYKDPPDWKKITIIPTSKRIYSFGEKRKNFLNNNHCFDSFLFLSVKRQKLKMKKDVIFSKLFSFSFLDAGWVQKFHPGIKRTGIFILICFYQI